MISFVHPHLLWLLSLLPVLALWRSARGPRAALPFPTTDIAEAVGATSRSRLGRLLPYARLPALALLIVGLARPQLIQAHSTVKASGVDIMLALDASGSMGTLDLSLDGQRADRLSVVKSVVSKFIDGRPNDRIGMIAFSGEPYLVSPLTLEHDWLERNLDRVALGTMTDGTAIGSALTSAVSRLRSSEARSKIVVLLTDGVNNVGKVQPSLAAEAAAALGIKVYTIGVGAEGMAPMPVIDAEGRRHLVMAQSDLDEKTLQQIAEKTHGAFFRATDTASLEAIYQRIDSLEKTTHEVNRTERHEEKFPWALLPGLALLVSELALGATWLRRVP